MCVLRSDRNDERILYGVRTRKKNREKNGGRTGIDESAMSLDKSKYDIGTRTHAHQIQDVSEIRVRRPRKLYNRTDDFA